MEATIIQPQIKKIKYRNNQKREANKENSLLVSTRKSQASQPPQEGKKNKKNNWRKPYSPTYMIPRIQKDAIKNFLKMAKTLMEFKDKGEKRMQKPHFPKK
ncbi:hypothetical protein O181_087492 [Austropuccinia psidii MF-1]|uniref:Uncharacterized protein n=1 Tax=Austropuccinia psidii MF-1 TaxID=1389203 RepID=A0A9Q3P393_9BASI|nr:hypothetical protein [Austropuccinia psidii MF-1]